MNLFKAFVICAAILPSIQAWALLVDVQYRYNHSNYSIGKSDAPPSFEKMKTFKFDTSQRDQPNYFKIEGLKTEIFCQFNLQDTANSGVEYSVSIKCEANGYVSVSKSICFENKRLSAASDGGVQFNLGGSGNIQESVNIDFTCNPQIKDVDSLAAELILKKRRSKQ